MRKILLLGSILSLGLTLAAPFAEAQVGPRGPYHHHRHWHHHHHHGY